jgi:hypothetical protein
VSVVSSGAVLSAAPSPLTVNQDSDISPPLSVETGANNNNKALISIDDKLSPNPPLVPGDENSAMGFSGAIDLVEVPPPAPAKRGRKRKKKEVVDGKMFSNFICFNLRKWSTLR